MPDPSAAKAKAAPTKAKAAPTEAAAAAAATRKSVVLEFGIDCLGEGGGKGIARTADGKKPGMHDRPWRKSAAAVKAEREESAKILGGSSGGTDLGCVTLVMSLQELLGELSVSGSGGAGEALDSLQSATTQLLQVATNARPQAEIDAARAAVDGAVEAAGLSEALAKRQPKQGNSATVKLQLLHEVLPRLWVGGWAALNDDCSALRQRKVTHIVSVLSADKRQLPAFVQGHLYVKVDDTEEAADSLAAHFGEIASFIEAAREAGGVVFVHCGAGISRAPTSVCCYLIWKLKMPASDAIKLVRKARPQARPNVGFVAALKKWEQQVKAGDAPEASTSGSAAAAAPAPVDVSSGTQ